MVFQGLDQATRRKQSGSPSSTGLLRRQQDYSMPAPARLRRHSGARTSGTRRSCAKIAGLRCCADDRPGAPPSNVFWAGNQGEAGQFLHGYQSAWLPASLLQQEQQARLADALFASSAALAHVAAFQQGARRRAGRRRRRGARHRDQPRGARCLCARDHRRRRAARVPGLRRPRARRGQGAPDAAGIDARDDGAAHGGPRRRGSYVSESNYFEGDWQQAYWGTNYARLRAVKRKYDRDGLVLRPPRRRQRGLERGRLLEGCAGVARDPAPRSKPAVLNDP